MKYQLNLGIWGEIFAVPTVIVDKHIQLCGAASLKVLLVLLRHNQKHLTIGDISQLVGLSSADTQDALNYWIVSGIVSQSENENIDIPQAPKEKETNTEGGQKVVKLTASRPRLTQEQISQIAQTDKTIQSLLEEAQALLGKPLSPSSTEILVSLFTYGGMPIELILMVIQYCVSIDKCNLRYIETTAYDWIDRGIDTLDKAEKYINELSNTYENEKKIKAAFGISNRNLTTKELSYVQKWFEQYKFDMQMVKLAYERTVDNKGSFSFPYCDAILGRWNEKGIRTPRQAVDENIRPSSANERTSSYNHVRSNAYTEKSSYSSSKERYDNAHAELQQRRNAARDKAAKQKEEVYSRVPRIKEIDTLLAKTGFEVSKAVLLGGDTNNLLQQLRDKNLSLQQEKENLLVSNGFSKDYLDIPYFCKQCEDKGYRPDGEPCECLKSLL